MRPLFSAMLLLPCLAVPALGQTSPSAVAPSVVAPSVVSPNAVSKTANGPHARMTWEQRFQMANVSHDGHLTPDQAKTGYQTIARHFADIDTGGKGFITQDDIRAWHKQLRTAPRPAPEEKLKPRHAFQRRSSDQPALKASATEVVPRPTSTVGPDTPTRQAGIASPG